MNTGRIVIEIVECKVFVFKSRGFSITQFQLFCDGKSGHTTLPFASTVHLIMSSDQTLGLGRDRNINHRFETSPIGIRACAIEVSILEFPDLVSRIQSEDNL